LIISASLSLAAIAIVPIYHEANAKECNDNRDNGHDDDSGSSSCSDKQDSNSHDDHHEHSHGSDVKKDKTPFVLAEPVPFP
jgi:hypothetical protein